MCRGIRCREPSSLASAFYADKKRPTVVEKNGTATTHHSPVTAKAITTTAHDSHQLKQNGQRIISPITFGACICTHCDTVQSSLTSHLFTKHHTHEVKHPVSTAAISTQPIKPIKPISPISLTFNL